MGDYVSWLQGNWFNLGNLIIQFCFLSLGIWFARSILKAMRASREQTAALLKLSMTDGAAERIPTGTARRVSQAGVPGWFSSSEAEGATLSDAMGDSMEIPESGPSWIVRGWRAAGDWLQAPMSAGNTGPLGRILEWLRAPVGS